MGSSAGSASPYSGDEHRMRQAGIWESAERVTDFRDYLDNSEIKKRATTPGFFRQLAGDEFSAQAGTVQRATRQALDQSMHKSHLTGMVGSGASERAKSDIVVESSSQLAALRQKGDAWASSQEESSMAELLKLEQQLQGMESDFMDANVQMAMRMGEDRWGEHRTAQAMGGLLGDANTMALYDEYGVYDKPKASGSSGGSSSAATPNKTYNETEFM